MLKSVEKVQAIDKYTVKFTLKEPFVWFLDMLANPHAVAIVAREVVEKHGDLKKWESVVGTGYPEELKNQSHINDPVVADMLVRQRRTFDAGKRREIIYDIQRHLAKQQYYIQMPSAIYVAVWEGALKNYGPNMGYDYGGRLMAAWLDR